MGSGSPPVRERSPTNRQGARVHEVTLASADDTCLQHRRPAETAASALPGEVDAQQRASELDLVARPDPHAARVAAMDGDDLTVAEDGGAVAAAFVEQAHLARRRIAPEARVGASDRLVDAIDDVEEGDTVAPVRPRSSVGSVLRPMDTVVPVNRHSGSTAAPSSTITCSSSVAGASAAAVTSRTGGVSATYVDVEDLARTPCRRRIVQTLQVHVERARCLRAEFRQAFMDAGAKAVERGSQRRAPPRATWTRTTAAEYGKTRRPRLTGCT